MDSDGSNECLNVYWIDSECSNENQNLLTEFRMPKCATAALRTILRFSIAIQNKTEKGHAKCVAMLPKYLLAKWQKKAKHIYITECCQFEGRTLNIVSLVI
jgi:hypothetical protein